MLIITDEVRTELIKKCIKSEEGWQALARSIKNEHDKEHCIKIFKNLSDSLDPKTVKIDLLGTLIKKLEYNINLLSMTEKI